MTSEFEMILTAFLLGIITLGSLLAAFWFVWTELRRYTDREIKKAKREMRKELR